MSTLILRLTGAQQSWGVDSRFRSRSAGSEPSRSGVIGMLAAAQGRERGEDLSAFTGLQFGVRVDQPGRLMTDYHTARKPGSAHSALSTRHYRSDAAYTAAVAGEGKFIETLTAALEEPAFPLYLGRRSCPAPYNLVGGIVDSDDPEAVLRDLEAAPWLASEWYRREAPTTVHLPLARDARPGEVGETVMDDPESFAPQHRRYRPRGVVRPEPVVVENPGGRARIDDFFETVKEG